MQASQHCSQWSQVPADPSCTDLYSHQRAREFLVAPYLLQRLVLPLPFSSQPFQWHRTVVLICIPLMSNADECLFVCFIGHLGIVFGQETVHFFCLDRFLTGQAQNPRLSSKEIVLLEF